MIDPDDLRLSLGEAVGCAAVGAGLVLIFVFLLLTLTMLG